MAGKAFGAEAGALAVLRSRSAAARCPLLRPVREPAEFLVVSKYRAGLKPARDSLWRDMRYNAVDLIRDIGVRNQRICSGLFYTLKKGDERWSSF